MKLKENLKKFIVPFIIGILIAVAALSLYKLKSTSYDYGELQTLLSDKVNHYEIVVTDQGREINIQSQRVADLENAIAAGLVREDELKEKNIKRLDHIVRLENRITMLEIEIALPDSSLVVVTDPVYNVDGFMIDEIIDPTSDFARTGSSVLSPGSYLRVPTNFFYSDDWLRMTGMITGPQIVIRELQMTTKPSIFIGYQKVGLFKPLRPVVTVEDANPYVSTIHMENVVIRQKPPFYKRPWWHRVEGAALIIGAQILLNKVQ